MAEIPRFSVWESTTSRRGPCTKANTGTHSPGQDQLAEVRFKRIWRGIARRWVAGYEAARQSAPELESRDGGVPSVPSRGLCWQASQSATSHFHAFGLLACSRASPRVRADCAHRTDSSATAAISAAPSAYAATVFLAYQMGSYIDGMGPSWPMSL
jgi:hypothetical protein